ncbi:HD domain-containing protein [Clostridium sp. BSD2780061688st1 H5]|uniref:HD domain-containing protein n=1 Tax=Eubacteriales TaxID=186802 RepID=UPI00325C12BD
MKRNMDLDKIQALKEKMVEFYRGCPEQIQHFLKVYAFAEMIGEAERLDEHTLFLLKSTALVHDIGIRPAKEKYG